MLIIIVGIIIGLLNLVDFGFVGLGEILLTIYMFYNGIVKKIKNVKFFKIYLFIIIFIIYISLYIIIRNMEFNFILKNLIKWSILLIQIISIYECLNKNETNTIQLLLPYLCTSKYIEVMNVRKEYFIHYFVLIFAFILLLRYKNIKKYEYILYAICIFYIIMGDSRISLVILISLFGFKMIYNILRDLYTQNLSKKIKNIILIICIIIFGILASEYVYKNISQETSSNTERTLLIQITIEEIKNNPIFGVGPGNFNNYAQKYLGYNLRDSELSPHNIYLEILAEYGIIGFSIFILILWDIIKALFNRKISLYTTFLIIYVLIYYLFSTFAGMNRIIFAVFIACILYYLNKDINERSINE